ncbi:cell division protein FtsH [candidate division WWE3 bacterium CG08_land_8_20_14_0_20_40_13]|uniref:ATP-dependent zinc metalloprotease FtsH n=1 Tax=candidate division WWE3 bacterium CG08_land_8_20_14_0_20_40_13 TaxID=1975084 RepID=A0A2H0XCZ9_UNCKA|nr:MAG: cell division protein FtsH [candidate division WWE3 bacterium CG08_land_8_20_14_0_20_40_13]
MTVKKPQNGINVFKILFILFILWLSLYPLIKPPSQNNVEQRPISDSLNQIKNGEAVKVVVEGDKVQATLKDGKIIESKKEAGSDFIKTLNDNGIDPTKIANGVEFKVRFDWTNFIANVAPIAISILFFYMIFRQSRVAAGDIFNLGKTRAKLFSKDPKATNGITFKDVAGGDEVKKELTEIVDFLKNPEKYRKLGARIPKGVLLIGPAGVGKTLMARALAGEAETSFYSVAGSEFMEMLVGVGSARVRDLFGMAKTTQPSVIFIDEIDAIGRQRGMGLGGGHDEREQTLNQILVEMDGFDPRTTVVVLAATNRPDMLDPALVRPGRFDRKIYLTLPDVAERAEIFKIHMRGKPFAKDVVAEDIAKQTVGFSGADIENMLNEAAILAARYNKEKIEKTDLRDASTKVKLGPERRRLQNDEEKKMTAYHEAGHAMVASQLSGMDPVERVSIVARTMTLGHTEISQKIERGNETKTRLLDFITMALGGRAAEEIVFKEETIGAANDIERATEIAKRMVTEFGMSPLGPINFESSDDRIWLARQLGKPTGYSDAVAEKIDEEVSKIITQSLKKAKEIIVKKRSTLDKVVEELLKKETLEREEFEALL